MTRISNIIPQIIKITSSAALFGFTSFFMLFVPLLGDTAWQNGSLLEQEIDKQVCNQQGQNQFPHTQNCFDHFNVNTSHPDTK